MQGIIDAFCRYYPTYSPADFTAITLWAGRRPCTPDGRPYIGNSMKHKNLTIAAGHGMLGLSLAPVSAELVTTLISGTQNVDPRLVPQRF